MTISWETNKLSFNRGRVASGVAPSTLPSPPSTYLPHCCLPIVLCALPAVDTAISSRTSTCIRRTFTAAETLPLTSKMGHRGPRCMWTFILRVDFMSCTVRSVRHLCTSGRSTLEICEVRTHQPVLYFALSFSLQTFAHFHRFYPACRFRSLCQEIYSRSIFYAAISNLACPRSVVQVWRSPG